MRVDRRVSADHSTALPERGTAAALALGGVQGPLAAAVAAALITALGMVPAVDLLRWLGLEQVVRQQGPASHLHKAGTPTAAGLVFVPAALLCAWALHPKNGVLFLALVVVAGHGILGFADDYLKVVRRRAEGLKARYKLIGQLVLSGLLATAALQAGLGRTLLVPFSGRVLTVSPVVFIALTVVAVLGTTNGTNFTDGADGLLGSTGGIALIAFGIVAWGCREGSISALGFAMAGALAAFLRWNWNPARVFMGDTGSMAIGATIAAIAVLTGTLLYLPLIGLLFVLEVLSVMAQVLWFRRTGRRLLRMAPLHHHLELGGLREVPLVTRLFGFSCVCAFVGVVGFWLR